MRQLVRPTFSVIAIGILLLLVFGCHHSRVVVEKHPVYTPAPPPEPGPPPWAPAHGYRAKHHYYYYPASYVYFDTGRKLYFYYSDSRWQVSVSLPTAIHIDVGDYVALDMETDRPYTYHSDVVRRYPPGQAKKLEGGKAKENRSDPRNLLSLLNIQ